MDTKRRHTERGFTLIEMMMSVIASGVLMFTVMNLMELSARGWKQGNAVRNMATEMAMSLNAMAEDIQGSNMDSIVVSATNDSLQVGSNILYFYTGAGSDDLVMERNGNSFTFLEDMLTSFSVASPVVGVEGDTLNMVSITMIVEAEGTQDSTTVWLTPRL